jgi:phenylpyruvate tautomerase PptA (4-oxalocrotonate tautomerase family)
MPVITVEGPKIADLVKTREMAQRITEAAAEAFGFPNERIIIIFHETTPECVATGGVLICDRPDRQSSSPPSEIQKA